MYFHYSDALLLLDLPEVEPDGRAGVPAEWGLDDLMWAMDVAQRNVLSVGLANRIGKDGIGISDDERAFGAGRNGAADIQVPGQDPAGVCGEVVAQLFDGGTHAFGIGSI